jgi:hypothetical protein
VKFFESASLLSFFKVDSLRTLLTRQQENHFMAYMMRLNTPYKGMPHVWNLSGTIGPQASATNHPDDIEVFQVLVTERLKLLPFKSQISATIEPLRVTRKMDATTAFHLMYMGDPDRPMLDALMASPAKNGQSSYGPSLWTIVYINWKLFSSNRLLWAAMHDPRGPCSASLQKALSKSTP